MQTFIITAKARKNTPRSKTYVVGWRANLDNLVIEKAVTERSVCFTDLTDATMWLTWAMMYLSVGFSYKIEAVEIEDIKKSMMKWTQPTWSRHIKNVSKHILSLPCYLKKE